MTKQQRETEEFGVKVFFHDLADAVRKKNILLAIEIDPNGNLVAKSALIGANISSRIIITASHEAVTTEVFGGNNFSVVKDSWVVQRGRTHMFSVEEMAGKIRSTFYNNA